MTQLYQSERYDYHRIGSAVKNPAILPRKGVECIIGFVHIYDNSDMVHQNQGKMGMPVDPYSFMALQNAPDNILEGLVSRIEDYWKISTLADQNRVRSELRELRDFEQRLAREFPEYRIPVPRTEYRSARQLRR